jgi:hypothetical protein
MMRPTAKRGRRRYWVAAIATAALLAAPPAQARNDAGTGARVPEEPTVVVVEAGDGFDWADAGIGAGVAAGLVLLGAATAKVVRRQRHAAAMRPRHP